VLPRGPTPRKARAYARTLQTGSIASPGIVTDLLARLGSKRSPLFDCSRAEDHSLPDAR
jgi:hypothetical protein